MTALPRLCLAVLAASAVAGCSGDPACAPVSGTVTHRGKALGGATVTFTPDGPGGRPAAAVTGPDGTFRLQTKASGGATREGAVPGAYKVTVSKFVPPRGMTEDEYARRVAAAQNATDPAAPAADLPPRVEALPKEFSDLAATKVAFTVTAAGPNEVKVDVP